MSSTKPTLNEAENGNKSKPLLGDVFIRVFCGVSIEDKCRHQLHPLNEVIQAQKALSLNKSIDFYSNSPDFVSAIKYLCQEKSISCEFFLNGESTGNDIEPIFENFNKSFDLLNELCPNIA
jgi:hypothetical protein